MAQFLRHHLGQKDGVPDCWSGFVFSSYLDCCLEQSEMTRYVFLPRVMHAVLLSFHENLSWNVRLNAPQVYSQILRL